MKRAQSIVEICMLAGLIGVITLAVFVVYNNKKIDLIEMSHVAPVESGGVCNGTGCEDPNNPGGGGGNPGPGGGGDPSPGGGGGKTNPGNGTCVGSETGGVCTGVGPGNGGGAGNGSFGGATGSDGS